MLPAVVYPVAALARSRKPRDRRSRTGARRRWSLGDDRGGAPRGERDGNIAVVAARRGPAETFELLCRAYALTQREREVVAALIAGLDTRALTEQLFISRHTVQDHLKSVFAKVGVHSRRELLATFSSAAQGTQLDRANQT